MPTADVIPSLARQPDRHPIYRVSNEQKDIPFLATSMFAHFLIPRSRPSFAPAGAVRVQEQERSALSADRQASKARRNRPASNTAKRLSAWPRTGRPIQIGLQLRLRHDGKNAILSAHQIRHRRRALEALRICYVHYTKVACPLFPLPLNLVVKPCLAFVIDGGRIHSKTPQTFSHADIHILIGVDF